MKVYVIQRWEDDLNIFASREGAHAFYAEEWANVWAKATRLNRYRQHPWEPEYEDNSWWSRHARAVGEAAARDEWLEKCWEWIDDGETEVRP